jgi:hypothetical protein
MANDPKGEIQIDDKEIAKLNAVHEHASRDKAMELGRIGYWLGSRDNAVIYIAAAVIVLSMIVATIMVLINTPASADLAKAFGALAISALGYMFGSIGRRDKSE